MVSMDLRCHTITAKAMKALFGQERYERSFAKFFPISEIIAELRKEPMP